MSSKNRERWFDGDSEPITFKNIIEDIEKSKDFGVFVGCDSHLVGGKYVFAIVIALYKPGWGGRFFFFKRKTDNKRFMNIKLRLLEETELAIISARKIRNVLPLRDIVIHLDINPDCRFKSSTILSNATSYVIAAGFQIAVKPQAWASSSIADAFAR